MASYRPAYGADWLGERLLIAEAAAGRSARVVENIPQERQWTAVALPCHSGFVRRLRVPLPSLAKARRVLPSVLDVELPFPLETCVYVFSGLKAAAGSATATAIAARRDDIDQFIQRCRKAGIDPVFIEHEALGLARGWDAIRTLGAREARVIVYLGEERLSLVLADAEGVISATGIREGISRLHADHPAIARLTLWWQHSAPAVETRDLSVGWTGPRASDEDIRASLFKTLFSTAIRQETAPDPSVFLAGALASACRLGALEATNLRRDALLHPALARREAAQERRAVFALALAGLFLGVTARAGTAVLERAKEAWQERLVALAREITGSERLPRGQEALAARRALDEQAPLRKAREQLGGAGPLPSLGALLQSAAQSGAQIHHVTAGPAAFQVKGSAEDWESGERLGAALQKMGFRIALEREDAGADERVHFVLKGERP